MIKDDLWLGTLGWTLDTFLVLQSIYPMLMEIAHAGNVLVPHILVGVGQVVESLEGDIVTTR